MLTSCAAGSIPSETVTSSVETTARSDPRRELLDDRTATPRIVEETVGNVRFKVALDREEYYLGDDIDIVVEAENISGGNITVRHDWGYSMHHAIFAAVYADGEPIGRQFMYMPMPRVEEYIDSSWSSGVILTNVGRYSTSMHYDQLKDAESVSIVIYFGTEQSRLEIPIALNTDVPDRPELMPYLQNGLISDALYRRACVAGSDEPIAAVIEDTARDAWDTDAFRQGEETQPHVYSYRGNTCSMLTPKQLLTYLERHAPSAGGEKMPLVYYSENSILSHLFEYVFPIRVSLN